jgi:hypothetical protein
MVDNLNAETIADKVGIDTIIFIKAFGYFNVV